MTATLRDTWAYVKLVIDTHWKLARLRGFG